MVTLVQNRLFILVLTGWTLGVLCACEAGGDGYADPATRSVAADSYETLDSLAHSAQERGKASEVIKHARRMSDIYGRGNVDAQIKAYKYIAHSYIALNSYDSTKYYLDRALALATEREDEAALADIYNLMGMQAIVKEIDYYKGLTYFMKALELSDESARERQYLIILCNVATTYNYRNDPAGLEYALKLYEYGIRNDDTFLRSMGAAITSSSYVLLGDYEKALHYIEITVSLVDIYGRHTAIYTQYADILLALGDTRKAEKYYRTAILHIEDGDALSATNAYLSYGKFLFDKRRYAEAIEIYRTGIRLSIETNNPIHRYQLYEGLSKAYRHTGDYLNALDSYALFHAEADSVFNKERERSINQLRIEYEAEKKEREIQQNKLVILKEKKKFQISLIVTVFFAIAFAGAYIYYVRKQKGYMRVIRQHQDTINKERWYWQSLAEVSENKTPSSPVSSLTDDKRRKLFNALEELMRTKEIYKMKDLTREKAAEMLSTNRTYLSQVLNEHTGLSFNYYVHSFRINEAVRVLSDPDNDIPLKALSDDLGFSAISTFYKLFQSTIGVTPSKFRETVKAKA